MSSTWRDVLARLTILQVWAALGGPPLRRNRGIAWWRGGKNYNVAIKLETDQWYDQKAHEGGGIPQLVMKALGCDSRTALRWLADLAGIELDAWTPDQRAHYYARRQTATVLAQRAADWASAKATWLDQQKQKALLLGDDRALELAARELYELERLNPKALLAAYCRDPEADIHERAGREDRLDAERTTELIVATLALAEPLEVIN